MDAPNALSDIPLRWMVRQIVESKCGILLDKDALEKLHIPIGDLTPSQIEEAAAREAKDALAPMHNAFRMMPLWWILELLPSSYIWQDADGRWRKTWG